MNIGDIQSLNERKRLLAKEDNPPAKKAKHTSVATTSKPSNSQEKNSAAGKRNIKNAGSQGTKRAKQDEVDDLEGFTMHMDTEISENLLDFLIILHGKHACMHIQPV